MKTEEKLHGSVKRFGARYGRKPKLKFSQIETEQRKLHKCPYCNKVAVKRVSLGIWKCRKCNAKFAGKAYSISKSFTIKEQAAEEPMAEEQQEAQEEMEEIEPEEE